MTRSVGIWSLIVVASAMLLTAGCAKKSTTASGAGTQIGASGPSAEEIRAREEEERRRRIAESQLASRPSTVSPGTLILDTVYFDFDEATLTDQAKDVLVRNADWLRANGTVRVQVEGNADERGTNEYNLALGERRAAAVKSYLSSLGIDGSRLVVISYGEERPADPNDGEEAWAKNRRVDFKAM
ncbi:MAG TPA: peptidoglycan-associated lipoprotein Pal [Candidatus Tectomicrobia bacterium]|nr:peptidoglycan-associated lipoprotein Pal [Candidatus Tectomicrobia bacterium]